jgi:hypothetical protein
MADDERAAGEAQDRLLQRAERFDVDVVGGLVKEQDVAAALEELGQVDSVAFTAREVLDRLLLIASAKIEVISLKTLLPSPSASRLWSTYESVTVSPTVIDPESGVSSPTSIRNKVVLPAPLGPTMPTIAPRGTMKLRSSNRSLSP